MKKKRDKQTQTERQRQKERERLTEKVNGPVWSKFNKEEIPGNGRSMHDILLTLRGNICQLWVLNRRDFYSCVRSTPLRDSYQTQADDDLWVTALTG